MRWLAAILVAAVLAACDVQQDGVVRVRYVAAKSADDLRAKCPSLVGRSTGCTKQERDGSFTIVTIPPKNVEDEQAMVPIGHEFLCHAWLRQSHSNVDPSNDCKHPL